MPKKIIRRKSSSSRHPERSRGISRSRPLSFWNFIRKNFLIIAGLLLLPITVGAVLTSTGTFSDLTKAAGKPRKITLKTQDRELTPLGADEICGSFPEAKSYKMINIDCNSCGYRCYSDPNPYYDKSYLGNDLAHNVSKDNSECLGIISRIDGCGTPGTPIPLPSPTTNPQGPPKVFYFGDDATNCSTCIKKYNYPPYDQWRPGGVEGDYVISVNRSEDSGCDSFYRAQPSLRCGPYDPEVTQVQGQIEQPTSAPTAGGGGGELKCECLPKPGDDCEGARIGNDGCPDGEGSLGQACCKTVTTKSGLDIFKAIKSIFGL